jgi:hypothetical protein
MRVLRSSSGVLVSVLGVLSNDKLAESAHLHLKNREKEQVSR